MCIVNFDTGSPVWNSLCHMLKLRVILNNQNNKHLDVLTSIRSLYQKKAGTHFFLIGRTRGWVKSCPRPCWPSLRMWVVSEKKLSTSFLLMKASRRGRKSKRQGVYYFGYAIRGWVVLSNSNQINLIVEVCHVLCDIIGCHGTVRTAAEKNISSANNEHQCRRGFFSATLAPSTKLW